MKTGCRHIFLLLLFFTISVGMVSAGNITTDLEYPDFWVKEAVGHYSLGNYDRALTLLDNAISQDPTIASAYLWRSKTLNELGRTKEAQESLAKAKELDPLIDDPYRKKVGGLADLSVTPVPTVRPTQTKDITKDMIQSDVNMSKGPDPTGPDLVMYDLQAALNPNTQQVEITAVIGNEGIKPSGTFFITFFGSYTTPVSSSDSPIGFYLVENLIPGTKKTITGYFPVSQIPSGDYYIGGYIDPNNEVREISKDNNGKTAPAKVNVPEVNASVGPQLGSAQLAVPKDPVVEPISTKRADLVVDAISGPTTAVLGEEILINTTVRNAGDADAGPFRLSVYLSRDGTVSSDDAELGYGDVTDLAVGKAREGTAIATIPLNVAPGTYYLVAFADSQVKIAEKNKLNNSRSQDAAITITRPPIPGDELTQTVTPETSPVPTPEPTETQAMVLTSVSPAQTTAPETSPVPTPEPTITPGSVITPVVTPAELLPDLVVRVISSGITGKPGGSFNVTTAIRNNGSADAGAFNVSLFLSPDTTINPEKDILVGLGRIESLPAGKERMGDAVVPIDPSIKPGIYYFGLLADSSDEIKESNKENNSGVGKDPIVIKQ